MASTNTVHPDTLRAMLAWRRDLHAHPETAFEEFRTSEIVARELAELGLDVQSGIAGTGVVASLANGPGPVIGLRADMDALFMTECEGRAHGSRRPGRMHGCGHDGHTAMLLGAARELARDLGFRGTVRFIFQPAEENECGGRAMLEDGLFERFPCDAVYALHNWPGLPAGRIAISHGAMMAAYDQFEIEVRGRGMHAAMPERGVDPFVVAAQIVLGLHALCGRRVAATDPAVLSVTQVHGGDTWNVVPDVVVIRGGVRSFSQAVQDTLEQGMRVLCESVAAAHGAQASVSYRRRYPATINSAAQAELAIAAARATVGTDQVLVDPLPAMASEDFGCMLQARPGAYAWIGADGAGPSVPLHNAHYDFNDDLLAIGAAYWVRLVQLSLPVDGALPGA